ncbi:hypothetical protein [Bacillus sp. 3103sda1]|uniref:hypothetical protein n=1 Tax=Bacillus sp. 3103sda1 TaxID=2953808 RepID=UPI0035C93568
MGQSAGENLAMLAAYSMGDTKLPSSTNVPSVTINSVINLYGPADLTKFYKNNPSPAYVQSVMKKEQVHQGVKSAQNEVEFIHKLFGLAS